MSYSNIRDFIYLDWEYVRSIASQMFEGIIEETSTTGSHGIETEGKAKGKVPLLFEGEAGGSYRYYKSENETKSLYRHIYSQVESELEKNGDITKIDENFILNKWSEDIFDDGEFFITQAPLRIIDYKWSNEWILNFESTFKTLSEIEKKTSGQKVKCDMDLTLAEIKKLNLKNLHKAIDTFIGDSIRIKVMPNRNSPECIFAGYAGRENFEISPFSIYHKYGLNIDANWTIFGQINNSSKASETIEFGEIGNQIEDNFEGFIVQLYDMIKMTCSVEYPAISLIQ